METTDAEFLGLSIFTVVVIASIVIPLGLAVIGVIAYGAYFMASGFYDVGRWLGVCGYIALWIFAFPIMAVVALFVGAFWMWILRSSNKEATPAKCSAT